MSAQSTHLFDLPADIIREITQPAYIGKSTNYVFKFVCKASAELTTSTTADKFPENAAAEGHLEILIWAHLNGYKCNGRTLWDAAITAGHLEVLKWIICVRKIYNPSYNAAGSCGHLHIVQYGFLTSRRVQSSGINMLAGAAQEGHLNVVKWLHEKGYRYDSAIEYAAGFGHLPVVKYLHENTNTNNNSFILCAPAQRGRIEVIEYLCSVGHVPNSTVYQFAVSWNQLNVLKWFHQHGFTLSGDLRDHAASKGYVEITAWLQSIGY